MVSVRKARKADLGALVRIFKDVREVADYAGQKMSASYFDSYLHSRASTIFVAIEDSKVVGGLVAEFADKHKYTFLIKIVVDKKYQRRGIGSMLMHNLEIISRKRKHNLLIGLVYSWNKNMQKIIEHKGYDESGKMVLYHKRI